MTKVGKFTTWSRTRLNCGCVIVDKTGGLEEPCATIADLFYEAADLARRGWSLPPEGKARLAVLDEALSKHVRSERAKRAVARRKGPRYAP